VLKILAQLQQVRSQRRGGDIDSSVLLLDFMRAYRAARSSLSEREREILYYRYELQSTRREVSEQLRISGSAIRNYEERAAEKIAQAYALASGDEQR
jgi:DNA-directed RNA polymerase specialized sigma subunit